MSVTAFYNKNSVYFFTKKQNSMREDQVKIEVCREK